ncbi:MAG: hypothetical protein D3922_07205 [Candidatus Electrothrix sp. AR1]|nr:hypothetical protein [Candidatus Electrothrix sp. AR1]
MKKRIILLDNYLQLDTKIMLLVLTLCGSALLNPINSLANPDEVKCNDGTYIGTIFTTSDFLELGTSSGESDIGFLSSESNSIGYNTSGSPLSFACGNIAETPISDINLESASSNFKCTINLEDKYVLIQGGNGAYYSIFHSTYNNWNGNENRISAQLCDPEGTFDSNAGCDNATACIPPNNSSAFLPPAILLFLLKN